MPLENVEAPLPGKVLSVRAKPGDKIAEYDEICVIEAMKMENPIVAPLSGIVKEVKVAAGTVVKTGDILASIEY